MLDSYAASNSATNVNHDSAGVFYSSHSDDKKYHQRLMTTSELKSWLADGNCAKQVVYMAPDAFMVEFFISTSEGDRKNRMPQAKGGAPC